MAGKEDKIEIVISSDPSSASHTPVEDVLAKDAPFPSNEFTGNKEEEMKRSNSNISGNNIGDPINKKKPSDPSPSSTLVVPEITSSSTPPPQDMSSMKSELYWSTYFRRWDKAEAIIDAFPDMIRAPLKDNTGRTSTALHVAVRGVSKESDSDSDFVKGLVNRMTPQDLEIRDYDGNTAFYLAVAALHLSPFNSLIPYMIEKNQNLHLIRGKGGLLPVEMAVVRGNHDVVQFLTSDHLLQKMDIKDIQNLFLITIRLSIFDVAMKLFEKDPARFIIARDDKDQTALHMLARKPVHDIHEIYELSGEDEEAISRWRVDEPKLRNRLLREVGQLEDKEVMELLTKPSAILFDAVISGNQEMVSSLILSSSTPPGLWVQKDSDGRTLLHCAALYRPGIFEYIIRYSPACMLLVREVDNDGNNFLHLAAHLSKQASSSWKPYSRQMAEAQSWFEDVKSKVPRELRIMRNNKGETPKETFDDDHKELYEKVKEEAKGKANSGMVVAALIATVAFAAALTVPGDKNSASFVVFILINTIALFTSSASIIFFLSVFTTSPKVPEEVLNDISVRLIKKGRQCLMISVIAMVVSFVAASFLIFGQKHKWVAYIVTLMSLPPLTLLLILQADLYMRRLFPCILTCITNFMWTVLKSHIFFLLIIRRQLV